MGGGTEKSLWGVWGERLFKEGKRGVRGESEGKLPARVLH